MAVLFRQLFPHGAGVPRLWRLARPVALAVALVSLGANPVLAQDVASGVCVMFCDDGPSDSWDDGGSTPTWTPTPSRPSGPTQQQLRQQRQQQNEMSMHEANDLGVEYFERGDWTNAIRYFEKALEFSPDDPVTLDNLEAARERRAQAQAQAEAEAERRRQEAEAEAEAERLRQEAEAEAERRRQEAQAEEAEAQAQAEAEAEAERRAADPGVWRQIANGFERLTAPDAEWRAKAQAWWKDTMQSEPVGDAATSA